MRHSQSFITIIKELIKAHVNRITALTQLASLEARLAGKALLNLLLLTLIIAFLLTSTWISILALIFIIIISFHFSLIFAAAVIVVLNFLLLGITYLIVKKMKKHLTFSATRRQLRLTS